MSLLVRQSHSFFCISSRIKDSLVAKQAFKFDSVIRDSCAKVEKCLRLKVAVVRDAYDAGRDHFSSFSKASHPIKSIVTGH